MNPLEFVLVKEPPNKGVIILSELQHHVPYSTGQCALTHGIKNVAETLYQALQAGEAECYKRRARDLEYICMRPSSEWTKRILLDANARRLEDTTDMEEIRPGQYRVSRRGALKLEASVLLRTMASSRDEGRPCVFCLIMAGH